MENEDQNPSQEELFGRPWEASEKTQEEETESESVDSEPADEEVFELSAEDVEKAGSTEDADGVDLTDWEAMASGHPELDELTSDSYSAATTEEYRGLAEDIAKAETEEWELQAVAATVPGVDSGLVGFEDVTGEEAAPEEHYEATEQAATSDMAMRIASALIIFGMFLGSLLLGGWWFTGFVALLMIVGTGEFYAAVRSKGYNPLALFGLVGVVLMAIGAQTTGAIAIAGWAAAVVVLTLLFFALTPRKHPLENAAVTLGGMAWLGLLSFAVLIEKGPDPVGMILFVVFLVAFNDMGAFFVGRGMGRRKLAPVLSPKKTIEGFVGGLVVSMGVAAILSTFPVWEEIGLTNALIIAAVIGVVSPIGDLIESMVKRSLDTKDMGSVLPGHGGILDRVDGFIMVIPVIYVLFRGLGLL